MDFFLFLVLLLFTGGGVPLCKVMSCEAKILNLGILLNGMMRKHLTNDIANNLCKPCSETGALDTSDLTAVIHKHNAPYFVAIAYFLDT